MLNKTISSTFPIYSFLPEKCLFFHCLLCFSSKKFTGSYGDSVLFNNFCGSTLSRALKKWSRLYLLISPLRLHSAFNLPTHDHPWKKSKLVPPHCLLHFSVTLCFCIHGPHKSVKLPRNNYNTKLRKCERLWIKEMKFSINVDGWTI